MFVAVASIAVTLPPIVICLLDQSRPPLRVYSNDGLGFLFLWSTVISSICGAVLARLGGLAGSFGSFGGFLCGAAYWFMHIQQMVARAPAQTGVPTEYPDSTMWLVPIGWVAIGAIVSFVPMIKNPRLNRNESQ